MPPMPAKGRPLLSSVNRTESSAKALLFFFITLAQKSIVGFCHFLSIREKVFFLLDKCEKIDYDLAQDRGARFISTLQVGSSIFRSRKGTSPKRE